MVAWMHINFVRKVILTHEKQFKRNSNFLADKLLHPTLTYRITQEVSNYTP